MEGIYLILVVVVFCFVFLKMTLEANIYPVSTVDDSVLLPYCQRGITFILHWTYPYLGTIMADPQLAIIHKVQ